MSVSRQQGRKVSVLFNKQRYFDTSSLTQPITITGYINQVNAVPEGVAASQRSGDVILQIYLDVIMNLTAENADIYSTTRFLIIRWKPNNFEHTPTVSDLFQNLGSDAVYSTFRWAYRADFQVLYDEFIAQAGTATNPTNSGNITKHFRLKLGGIKQQFFNDSTYSTNSLWVVAVSDSAITPSPLLNITTRFVFGLP
jgi:hypothetical protein